MTGQPGILFVPAENTELPVRCEKGHDTFRLVLRYRLAGALVTRHAKCVTCGEEHPLDES